MAAIIRAISSLVLHHPSYCQPIHLAQASFVLEAFSTKFILDLELNQ